MTFENTAVLGAGTIGMSWAALFAASGRAVTVFDPAPDTETRVKTYLSQAAPALTKLGYSSAGDLSRLRFTSDAVKAVQSADFIQENIPERLELKHALYRQIEPALLPEAIIGSSTSGLPLSQLQVGFDDPGQFLLAHPFNPPHLIPLVELMGNDKTNESVIEHARSFYESLGKQCVELHKEVPGHIANRLQAAIWREAIHLAMEGVASVEDIDKAVAYGPGLRWAAMGPNTLLHLGGGAGGIRAFCDHLGAPFQSWWDDLGQPRLTAEVVDQLEQGVADALDGLTQEELALKRDRLIVEYLLAARTQT